MGYKNDDKCLAKVADDEPIFVLRAKDLSAPGTVRIWAANNVGTLSAAKYTEAMQLARLMESWQDEHVEAKFPD